jgi:Virulence protein RhuM family
MPKRKHQKPPKIDADFNEALERVEQTDPNEVLPDAGEPTDAKTGNELVLYHTAKGQRIRARYDGATLWMTIAEVAHLFGRSVSVITRHIANVVEEGELPAANNLQKMQVNTRGKPPTLCSLDMIISVGYRVSSKEATQFRIWATSVLKEFIVKGFALDDERLAGLSNATISLNSANGLLRFAPAKRWSTLS